jgi:WD40 repeat protein
VVFSPSGETVYSTDGTNLIQAWDVSSSLPVFGGGRLGGGQILAFSPNGKVAVARSRNVLIVVDLVDKRVSSDIEVGLDTYTFFSVYASLSSDGTKALIVDYGGNVSLWDLVERRALFPFLTKTYYGVYNEGRNASADSPAGSVVLVASSLMPKLEIRDVKTGNILRIIIAHEQGTRASAFSSDGTEIATVGMDNSFKLWNVESGKLLNTYDTSAVSVINRVAFSSYRKLLITGHDDGSMTIWSAETGSILKQFKAHDGWVETIAVSPDGQGLASGGPYGKVNYWNLAKILAE